MHFHLPKPLHGWREFAGEVGIIVIGVLIALAAEAVLEDWRWQRHVEQSTRAFKEELLIAASDGYERMAIQPCLQGRLRALAAQLNGSSGQWRAMPDRFSGANRYYMSVLPTVYRPPTRNVLDDAWRNALADGTINHLDLARAQNLSGAYESAQEFKAAEAEEGSMETRLSPLGMNRTLDQRTRIEMLQTIAQLDRLNGLLMVDSRDLIGALRAAKLGISQAETEDIRKTVLDTQRGYRGACVTAPPLNLGDQ